MGSKAWLIYSARLNTIYASTNCTFDETLFPSRVTDQLAYGYYDSEPTTTFRTDSVPNVTSPLFDPVWLPEHIEDADGTLSQASTVPSSPISEHDLQFPGSIVKESASNASAPDDTSMSGGGSDAIPAPGWGLNVDDQLSSPSDPVSAGSSVGSPRLLKHWTDCKDDLLTEDSDDALAEYLIGNSLEFTLPQDYWPCDKRAWTISCSDSRRATSKDYGFKTGSTLMIGIFIAGQCQSSIGKSVRIPMTGQWPMRRAIKESKPSAVSVRDIIKPDQIPRSSRSNLAALVLSCVNTVVGRTTQRIQIDS
eukprot:3553507-Rhodomonas_salina.4